MLSFVPFPHRWANDEAFQSLAMAAHCLLAHNAKIVGDFVVSK